jgi:hypothetical protein
VILDLQEQQGKRVQIHSSAQQEAEDLPALLGPLGLQDLPESLDKLDRLDLQAKKLDHKDQLEIQEQPALQEPPDPLVAKVDPEHPSVRLVLQGLPDKHKPVAF